MSRAGPILLATAAATFVAHTIYLECVAEDAFITFRFARNWVSGLGLLWNAGEAPVEGYTNFLWLCISAEVLKLGVDVPRAMQVVGVAAGLGSLATTWLGARRLLDWPPLAASIPCFALALSGPFATWAAGGLETGLFGFLLVAAAFHFSAWWRFGRSAHLLPAFGLLLLGMLTRPEGAMAYATLAAIGVLVVRDRDGAQRRSLGLAIALTSALFGAYFAWRWSYFGYPLPNTFYAKVGSTGAQAMRGIHYLLYFALHFLLPWVPLGVLAVFGLRRSDRSPHPGVRLGERLSRNALLVVSGAQLAWYVPYVALVGGDYMAMYRFMAPVLPFVVLLLGALAAALLRSFDAPGLRRVGVAGGLGIAALGTVVHSLPVEERLFSKPPRMHGNWRGVQTERWHVARLTGIGDFFASYGRGPEESVATSAIGAIGYHSNLSVHGRHGLVDPEIAHQAEGSRFGQGLPGHEKGDLRRVFARKPTFYVGNRRLRSEPLARPPKLGPGIDAIVARDYRVASAWIDDAVNGEAGWFSFLERRDRRPGVPLPQPPAEAPDRVSTPR